MRPKARLRRSKLEPINLDELANDPGLRGMLSFLEVTPEDKARRLALRDQADRNSPIGREESLPCPGIR